MKDKISVMVVTYNSAGTIESTLNSILEQTYGSENIELVISDDCSKDNTTDIICSWLKSHREDFFRAILIQKDMNTGISQNCNSGWKECTSEWIKSIGGDDLLLPNCIDRNVSFVARHKECKIVFSSMEWFGQISRVTPEPYNLSFFTLPANEQYYYLMFKSFNIAPTSFINKMALEKIGYADSKFTLIEDLPLWLKLTSNGIKLYFFPDVTVRYRVENSTSKHVERYVNLPFLRQLIQIDNSFNFNEMPSLYYKMMKIDTYVLLHGKRLIAFLTNNKVGIISKLLDVIHFILRPIYMFRKINRHLTNYFYAKKVTH
jgi:glycosyltransferase involved in cell wall biosynthesis